MEIFKQYDVFKEKCINFTSELEGRCFTDAKMFCHPTIQNEIIAICSDEEARSNAIHICRMSDMLLMSDDAEEWEAFNLSDARKIAEQNGYIYLTDLLSESAFYAEEWMVSGKNDTIIVSEEYMREKGKKYAPVTPLTNRVMHFKKQFNSFFWKKSADGQIIILDHDYIQNCIVDYFNKCSKSLPSLSNAKTITFPLFDDKVMVDINTTRVIEVDKYFEKMNSIINVFNNNSDILEISEYKFSIIDFLIELTIAALNNDGIYVTKDEFLKDYYIKIADLPEDERNEKLDIINVKSGNVDIECIKYAYLAALSDFNDFDFKYPAGDAADYDKLMRKIELSNSTRSDAEKFILIELLAQKPSDYLVLAYLYMHYPEEEENISAISDFWNIPALTDEEMKLKIYNAYVPADSFNIDGEFCPGYEKALIIYENLAIVEKKYGYTNSETLVAINDYIVNIDENSRTYNGTIFDTTEDMQKAMKNELEMRDLCVDLSAMNKDELLGLRKHIMSLTIDNKNKAKYLVKIKVALNSIEENTLKQLCLGLSLLNLDDAVKLKEKVIALEYDDAIVSPYISKIDDQILSAQRNELTALFADADKMSDEKLADTAKILDDDKYSKFLVKYFKNKVENIKEERIVKDINDMCSGFESMNVSELTKLKGNITAKDYPVRYTNRVFSKIDKLMIDYDKNQLVKLFEGIDFASQDEIESIKEDIKKNNYNEDILNPYLEKIKIREQEIIDEELTDLCKDIDNMTQEQLNILSITINESEKPYNAELLEKYNDKIAHKEVEFKNSELAELCKYIFSMEFDALYELKDVLLSDKYDTELTSVYLKKINEREVELNQIELEKLCSNLSEMNIEQLEKLKGDIFDEDAYTDICDPFIIKINNHIEDIKLAEFKALLNSVDEMNSDELDDFTKHIDEIRADIGETLYNAGIGRVEERFDAIEIEKLDKICDDIENFDFDKTRNVLNSISSDNFKDYNSNPYIEKLNNRITDLHLAELDKITNSYESLTKDQLINVINNINEYKNDCPNSLKTSYIEKIEHHIKFLAEKEVKEICGDIKDLSVKKSFEIIRQINIMSLETDIKNEYLDKLDSHIMANKERESKDYISFLTQKMTEFSVTSAQLFVPTMTNNFFTKYDTACKLYVSSGRYELPILMHEAASDEGFTLTTEYLYFVVHPNTINKVKIDDLASFQAKKGLMASALTAIDKSGNLHDIPNAFNKSVIENAAKVLTALTCYMRDQRAAEHMKDLLESAVKERTQEIPVVSAESIVEEIVAPEPVELEIPDNVDDILDNAEVKTEKIEDNDTFESIDVPDDTDELADEADVDEDTEKKSETDEKASKADDEDDMDQDDNDEEVKAKFCEECGAKIVNNKAKFCYECGHKLI